MMLFIGTDVKKFNITSFTHQLILCSEWVVSVLNKYVGEFSCEKTTGDGPFHWRKWYYELWTGILARSEGLKYTLMMDLFLTNMQVFASQR